MRVPCLVLLMMVGGSLAAPAVLAHDGDDAPAVVQDIDPAAQEAVAVVDAFSNAIQGMRIDEASALLDPAVLVLESGGSERNRDQYLAEHAQADAEYMKDARQQLRYRQARIVGDVAWVGTESTLTRDKDGKPVSSLSTETMLLRKTAQGWKIVHIHWSSRPAPASK
jgi:ketosteroid isomerase-like protein